MKSRWLLLVAFAWIFVAKSEEGREAKIIGLLTVRNEEIMIAQCLRALSLYTDAIVILDDVSDDNTVAIAESLAHECNIISIIKKTEWLRDEPGDRNKLLQEGRALGGTHFIVIDADEMFTANCFKDNFLRNHILDLQPGERLELIWIQLWRSVWQYRFDSSVWTWNYGDIAFCDDGECFYSSDFIHTSRTPANLLGEVYYLEDYTYGLLHFQFVNWRNLLIKQAWYRCLERIRLPGKPIEEINWRYAPSKDETDLGLRGAPNVWFKGYDFFDASIFEKSELWREKQVLFWFEQYGRDYFVELDIWDIDWGEGISRDHF